MKDVIVTPHIGVGSTDHMIEGTEYEAKNALRLLDEKLPRLTANPEGIVKWKDRFGIEKVSYAGTTYFN